ncbi:hypothetical protein ACQKM9_01660 [Viridibacillus sp. NPDC093762]|uniref:hypothetical protein n=1 Tax=Viridibacillus sp. NPDC093762 TaxID=3390720 RepID=UPI003D05A27E
MYNQYVIQSRNNYSQSILSPTISSEAWPFPLLKEKFINTLSKRESFRLFDVSKRQLTNNQLNSLATHATQCITQFHLQDLLKVCFIDQAKLLSTERAVYIRNQQEWEQKCVLTNSSIEESLYLQLEMHRASGVFYFEWDVNRITEFKRLIDYRYMLAMSGLLGHQLSLKATEMELRSTVFAGLTLIEYLEELQHNREMQRLPLFAFAIQ